MSVPQKDYETLLSKYKQLELQFASQNTNSNSNTPQTFNTLRGLAQEAATLNETVILRYFIQGLAKDFRIAITATAPRDLAAAQADVHRVELILHRRDNHPALTIQWIRLKANRTASSEGLATGVATKATWSANAGRRQLASHARSPHNVAPTLASVSAVDDLAIVLLNVKHM
jgi:hypothetical protein